MAREKPRRPAKAGHGLCIDWPVVDGIGRMHAGFGKDLMVVLFATTAGFTASGILANLYRLIVGDKPQSSSGQTIYVALMVFAGPSVLLENAASAFKAKSCSRTAFWLAAAIAGYWSFAIGLLVMNLSLAL